MRKRVRTLETPQGAGEVYAGGQVIAQVKYALRVSQEILVTHSFGDDVGALPGVESSRGTLWRISGEDFPGREDLTLRLQDGRTLAFLVDDGPGPQSRYTIRGNGGFE